MLWLSIEHFIIGFYNRKQIIYIYTLYVFNTKKHDRLYSPHLIVNFHIFVSGHWFSIYHDIIKISYLAILLRAYEKLSCSWFYRFRLFVFLVLQIPAFRVPGFTDSGFSCSWFYRFRLFVFLVLQISAFRVPAFTDSGFSCSWVLQIPAFRVPGFTDSGFSCSWFYRFRLFVFLVFSFLVPFPVPCFTDSRHIGVPFKIMYSQ